MNLNWKHKRNMNRNSWSFKTKTWANQIRVILYHLQTGHMRRNTWCPVWEPKLNWRCESTAICKDSSKMFIRGIRIGKNWLENLKSRILRRNWKNKMRLPCLNSCLIRSVRSKMLLPISQKTISLPVNLRRNRRKMRKKILESRNSPRTCGGRRDWRTRKTTTMVTTIPRQHKGFSLPIEPDIPWAD